MLGGRRAGAVPARADLLRRRLSASMSVDTWQDPGAFVSRTTDDARDHRLRIARLRRPRCRSRRARTKRLPVRPRTRSEAAAGTGARRPGSVRPEEQQPGAASRCVGEPVGCGGLQACSPAQIGLDDESEPSCPEASKIGEVEIETPLLSNVVKGSVYVAEQDNNPFGSLLAIYLVAQADGALVKLAGHIEANPETGQSTTSFENLPQLPFSDLQPRTCSAGRAPPSRRLKAAARSSPRARGGRGAASLR